MDKQLEKIRHDYIRYANCWEDADVLLEGLQLEDNDRILSIGSAGDNSFSLMVNNPSLVVAVDINLIQLHLIELKKAAFKSLNHQNFLSFLGFTSCENRRELFNQVKENLSPELGAFWENRIAEIESGIIYNGKFESYFGLFRNKILPFIHSSKNIDDLFAIKPGKSQSNFFYKKWNNWRWKMLFKLFFSRFVMGRFGRDPAFLNEVKISVSGFILDQAEKHLSSVDCQSNYFLNFILKGDFGKDLPHYARPENFELIKRNIDKLQIFHGLAEDAFKEYSNFNKFNLSNIFEYMNPEVFHLVASNLVENSSPKARFAYWNLMVDRQMSDIIPTLEKDENTSTMATKKDKGFFYKSVNFDSLK